ncbi:MAG: methionyl-tRNA formyltransferase [Dehalococcoidaceae bacterium]|nr:methionyl-tRNA formyltransferase [Dehalococcoidaceae bacterium]|tara:strand:- start:198 stop:785 length:588 start_codon:yes stop_codon:yes gene_type:complete
MKEVVGFLSREHGLEVLNSLIKSSSYKLIKVYTHSLKPKSEDPQRAIREDYIIYKKICQEHDIPLEPIDSKDFVIEDFPKCDFIIEVSWRYLISKNIISSPRISSIGIHRGELPKFAGAEPMKKAIMNKEKNIIVTAHYLDKNIDEGETITSITHPINYDSQMTLDENILRLRNEITKYFSKLTFDAFRIYEEKF